MAPEGHRTSRRVLSRDFWLRRSALVILPATLVFGGCAFLAAHPPLPKHSAIETTAAPRDPDEFARVVARAEVFYVPADRAGWALRPEPGWSLIEALRQAGPFAIGWDAISSDQQPLLDRSGGEAVGTAARVAQVVLQGPENERENSRALVLQTNALGVRQVALRQPPSISLPAAAGNDGSRWIAERIVAQLRERAGEKLLVFLSREELDHPASVPALVAQRSNARQLILDSRPAADPRAPLLTSN